MDDLLLAILRCPLDPARVAELRREDQNLVCTCGVRFPIRNGLPILVPDEAELPDGIAHPKALPCRQGN